MLRSSSEYIYRQLKYYQDSIRKEIGISLKIIQVIKNYLNVFLSHMFH